MPIHIHPASVAQGKYFPKHSINRKTIFEQLRGETERVRNGRRWRGTGGEILILYVYMRYIFIKKPVLKVKVEKEAAQDKNVIWYSGVINYCWNWIIAVLTARNLGILNLVNRQSAEAKPKHQFFSCYYWTKVKNSMEASTTTAERGRKTHTVRIWKDFYSKLKSSLATELWHISTWLRYQRNHIVCY